MRACDSGSQAGTGHDLACRRAGGQGRALRLPREGRTQVGDRPRIVGILNCTPDSFSDGGRFASPDDAVEGGLRMISQGADWIDIGGESTRPGATPVPPRVQLDRILPVIRSLRAESTVPLSVDTMSPRVAAKALDSGADIVNDVSGCRDPDWPSVLREWDCPVILMHMRGSPRDMQVDPQYPVGATTEVCRFFAEKLRWLEELGFDRRQVILDPGIGFGKRFKDNWELIRNIEAVRTFQCPILLGTSRKRFLREILGKDLRSLDMGTALVNAMAIMNGVDLLRVHDVPLAVTLVRLFTALRGGSGGPLAAGEVVRRDTAPRNRERS